MGDHTSHRICTCVHTTVGTYGIIVGLFPSLEYMDWTQIRTLLHVREEIVDQQHAVVT